MRRHKGAVQNWRDGGRFEPAAPLVSSEQIVTFQLTVREPSDTLEIPIAWASKTLSGREHLDHDHLDISPQRVQPEWETLLKNPPYSLNAVTKRDRLVGREAILDRLILNAASGTSTFIWGQKRVGKTSVAQVLADELLGLGPFLCVFFRIGEIAPLHEGQIGHRIAQRLAAECPGSETLVPREEELGAGLGAAIPVVERLISKHTDRKFVVIMDEFDDLNPAFYLGERGGLFVRALRSLSEVGLTFFFVGSERMKVIYDRHQVYLNKWADVSLDCIETREDRKTLVLRPVENAVDYETDCVSMITDYCGGNPFYTHSICANLFENCYHERRTYVSVADFLTVKQARVHSIGETNFAHFWEHVPELDRKEKDRQAALNCLVLSGISALG